jgi:mannose-6-phosphate isomerase-like protein (cupin superfamily)
MAKENSIMFPINIFHKFSLFEDYWHPRIVAELNDSYIKVAKLKGEFIWHEHKNEDELFLVVKGRLTIRMKAQDVVVEAGEFFIVPKGVSHMPVAEEEVEVVLVEPKTTVNTGENRGDKTVHPQWV